MGEIFMVILLPISLTQINYKKNPASKLAGFLKSNRKINYRYKVCSIITL
jgi:hypothetical protein